MSLLPYGYGDGGGGPTREMTQTMARTGSLEGSPRLRHSTSAAFFTAAEQEYAIPEIWSGELYLEFHRGTYTSQLRTKQGNRRSEHLLREAELWAATATVRTGADYPAEQLQRLWRLVLLQQFHDILPGSSIAWVHQDAERNYAAIAVELEEIIDRSLRALVGDGDLTVVANAAPHARDGAAALSVGVAGVEGAVEVTAQDGGVVLADERVRVVVDADGLVVSIRDLATGRETVPPGQVAGLLQLHRDTPTQWDAWDIDEHYRRNVTDLVSADAVTVDGAVVVIDRSFGGSTVTQRLWLESGPDSSVLRMALDIDWHEKQKLLKLAFPVDVHTDRAASEIQFGHVVRPTHTNTSWDAARFETVAHRWVQVAEPGFGAAVVNDSTYGHDITRHARDGGGTYSTIRLSLVRAALFPDPQQDQGRHHLEVGFVVGAEVADAVREGYRINLADRVVTDAGVAAVAPLVTVDDPGVVVEAVKLATDGTGDVIIRLYEALGRRTTARVTPGFAASSVTETDLLERPVDANAATAHDGGAVDLALRPFQIVTLRLGR